VLHKLKILLLKRERKVLDTWLTGTDKSNSYFLLLSFESFLPFQRIWLPSTGWSRG